MNINGGATIWARKTIDSVIFYDKPSDWFKIWFFIVNQVNHSKYRKWEKGQGFMTYSQIMEKTKTTRGQVDMCLRFLKKSQMLTTQKTTRGMIVSVLKYDLYQDLKNYKNDTKNEIGTIQERYRNDTINKNDKNDKNDKNVYTLYKEKINSNSRLLKKAKEKIKKRLETFSYKEIEKAIINFSQDDWKMKNNGARGIAWFFHSDERIESYINLENKKTLKTTKYDHLTKIIKK